MAKRARWRLLVGDRGKGRQAPLPVEVFRNIDLGVEGAFEEMVARVARYVFDRAAREGNASNTQAVNGPPFEIGAVDDFHVQETCEVVETGNGRVKIGISQETIC